MRTLIKSAKLVFYALSVYYVFVYVLGLVMAG